MEKYSKTIQLYHDNVGRVQYIDHLGNDKRICQAARISFGEDNELPLDDRDIKLISYLMKNKHTSVFEHCHLTFKFVVPLFVRSQHHRHRTWSFSEISRRYTSENIQFFEPNHFRTQHIKDKQASNIDSINPNVFYSRKAAKASVVLKEFVSDAFNLYENMLGAGICREQARMILPQNMYTSYYGTIDLNNLFKFLLLRNSEHSQFEIKRVAIACTTILSDLFPHTYEAFEKCNTTL